MARHNKDNDYPAKVRTTPEALSLVRKKTDEYSGERDSIFTDAIAYIVRNGFPRILKYRLAEKYRSDSIDETTEQSVSRMEKHLQKIVEDLSPFNERYSIDTALEEELDIIEYIATAKFPKACRTFMRAELDHIEFGRVLAIVANFLDKDIVRLIEINNVLQLSITDNAGFLVNKLKCRKNYKNKEHTDFLHKSVRKQVEKLNKISEYRIFMNDETFFKAYENLSDKNKSLAQKFMNALKADEREAEIFALELPPQGKYYRGLKEDGPIVQFIAEVYGHLLDGINFGRKELDDCDPKAARALRAHETKRGKIPLEALNLPTLEQKNKALVAGLTPRQMVAAHSTMQTGKRYEILDAKHAEL